MNYNQIMAQRAKIEAFQKARKEREEAPTAIKRKAYLFSDITSYAVQQGTTGIGHEAFYGCEDLVVFYIPASVTWIGDRAFTKCVNLRTINYGGTIEQWKAIEKGKHWFSFKNGRKVVCTDGIVSQY